MSQPTFSNVATIVNVVPSDVRKSGNGSRQAIYTTVWRLVNRNACTTGSIGTPAALYSSKRFIATAKVCGICQINKTKAKTIGIICHADSIAAQPIKGVTAPDTLPITVLSVYLLFVQNVYNTT